MTRDDLAWAAIVAAVVVAEHRGVYRGGKPLTNYVRRLKAVRAGPLPIGYIAVAGSLCWLADHFLIDED